VRSWRFEPGSRRRALAWHTSAAEPSDESAPTGTADLDEAIVVGQAVLMAAVPTIRTSK
jgi:hypothetical protein